MLKDHTQTLLVFLMANRCMIIDEWTVACLTVSTLVCELLVTVPTKNFPTKWVPILALWSLAWIQIIHAAFHTEVVGLQVMSIFCSFGWLIQQVILSNVSSTNLLWVKLLTEGVLNAVLFCMIARGVL